MNPITEYHEEPRSVDAGTARIERLALALLDEVRKLETGRRFHNAIELERFKQLLEERTEPKPAAGLV